MKDEPPRRRELLLDRMRLLAEAERAWAEAREHFVAFRQYMRPDAVWNWWTQDVALELQQFYDDMVAGRRPKLALMAPPQHGKIDHGGRLHRLGGRQKPELEDHLRELQRAARR